MPRFGGPSARCHWPHTPTRLARPRVPAQPSTWSQRWAWMGGCTLFAGACWGPWMVQGWALRHCWVYATSSNKQDLPRRAAVTRLDGGIAEHCCTPKHSLPAHLPLPHLPCQAAEALASHELRTLYLSQKEARMNAGFRWAGSQAAGKKAVWVWGGAPGLACAVHGPAAAWYSQLSTAFCTNATCRC